MILPASELLHGKLKCHTTCFFYCIFREQPQNHQRTSFLRSSEPGHAGPEPEHTGRRVIQAKPAFCESHSSLCMFHVPPAATNSLIMDYLLLFTD